MLASIPEVPVGTRRSAPAEHRIVRTGPGRNGTAGASPTGRRWGRHNGGVRLRRERSTIGRGAERGFGRSYSGAPGRGSRVTWFDQAGSAFRSWKFDVAWIGDRSCVGRSSIGAPHWAQDPVRGRRALTGLPAARATRIGVARPPSPRRPHRDQRELRGRTVGTGVDPRESGEASRDQKPGGSNARPGRKARRPSSATRS